MENIIVLSATVLGLLLMLMIWLYGLIKRTTISKRKSYIADYRFPIAIKSKLQQAYPNLNEQQLNEILEALREYFQICILSGERSVSMPSKAVDLAWHEFILMTREYKSFCHKAFGKYLHHTPSASINSKYEDNQGLKRAWFHSCQRAHIDPNNADKLPVLFNLDSDLNIPDGYRFSLSSMGDSFEGFFVGDLGCISGGCSGD